MRSNQTSDAPEDGSLKISLSEELWKFVLREQGQNTFRPNVLPQYLKH